MLAAIWTNWKQRKCSGNNISISKWIKFFSWRYRPLDTWYEVFPGNRYVDTHFPPSLPLKEPFSFFLFKKLRNVLKLKKNQLSDFCDSWVPNLRSKVIQNSKFFKHLALFSISELGVAYCVGCLHICLVEDNVLISILLFLLQLKYYPGYRKDPFWVLSYFSSTSMICQDVSHH